MARTETREDIITVGSELIARGGFGQTGIDAILKKAKIPKGSFYYYFSSKEDFGLAVIDRFGSEMLEKTRGKLTDEATPPLARLRTYFESSLSMMTKNECKRGCLLGDLGQELATQSETFRKRLEQVFDDWKAEIAGCLKKARAAGELGKSADPVQLADFIVSGWEGAILRAKVKHSVDPLKQFLEVLFSKVLIP